MANGRTSRLTRMIGLALARRALWRALAVNGTAGGVLATVISGARQAPDLHHGG
jgi:hypothetical protein